MSFLKRLFGVPDFTAFNNQLSGFLDEVGARSVHMVIINITFWGSTTPAAFFSARSFVVPSSKRSDGFPNMPRRINIFFIPEFTTGHAAGKSAVTVAGDLTSTEIAEILRAAPAAEAEVTRCKGVKGLGASRVVEAQLAVSIGE